MTQHENPQHGNHQLGRQAEAGALIGALAGAAIGAGGGLLATSGDISGRTTLFLAIVFVFTGLGAWVGSVLTAMETMSYDETEVASDSRGDLVATSSRGRAGRSS